MWISIQLKLTIIVCRWCEFQYSLNLQLSYVDDVNSNTAQTNHYRMYDVNSNTVQTNHYRMYDVNSNTAQTNHYRM